MVFLVCGFDLSQTLAIENYLASDRVDERSVSFPPYPPLPSLSFYDPDFGINENHENWLKCRETKRQRSLICYCIPEMPIQRTELGKSRNWGATLCLPFLRLARIHLLEPPLFPLPWHIVAGSWNAAILKTWPRMWVFQAVTELFYQVCYPGS